jgi:hypothetical protein
MGGGAEEPAIMKITRDDKTWNYTCTDEAGGVRILPSVTTIIDAALGHFQGFKISDFKGMLEADEPDRSKIERITVGAVAMTSKIKNAGNFGQAVHTLTELEDHGELDEDDLDTALRPILEAWRKFKSDHAPKILMRESKVCHRRLGYAGTIDGIIDMHGSEAVLEIKSRKYLEGRDELQTVAYAKAYEDTLKVTKLKTRRYVIELKLDGTYILTENKSAGDWEMFRCCLAIWYWRVNHGLK